MHPAAPGSRRGERRRERRLGRAVAAFIVGVAAVLAPLLAAAPAQAAAYGLRGVDRRLLARQLRRGRHARLLPRPRPSRPGRLRSGRGLRHERLRRPVAEPDGRPRRARLDDRPDGRPGPRARGERRDLDRHERLHPERPPTPRRSRTRSPPGSDAYAPAPGSGTMAMSIATGGGAGVRVPRDPHRRCRLDGRDDGTISLVNAVFGDTRPHHEDRGLRRRAVVPDSGRAARTGSVQDLCGVLRERIPPVRGPAAFTIYYYGPTYQPMIGVNEPAIVTVDRQRGGRRISGRTPSRRQ